MATRSRPRPSGKRKSFSGPRLGKAAKQLGRHLLPKSRRGKRAMAIGLGLAAVAALTVGLVAESLLSYTVSTMGALGAVAVKRAEQWQAQQEQEKQAHRARPAPAAPPPPGPSAAGGPRPAGSPPRCTATGKPTDRAAPDACTCAPRHVQTAEGAARYGLSIGSPIRTGGRRAPASGGKDAANA